MYPLDFKSDAQILPLLLPAASTCADYSLSPGLRVLSVKWGCEDLVKMCKALSTPFQEAEALVNGIRAQGAGFSCFSCFWCVRFLPVDIVGGPVICVILRVYQSVGSLLCKEAIWKRLDLDQNVDFPQDQGLC